MSDSLIIRDGNGNIKTLQVNSGSNGYISNTTLVPASDDTIIKSFYNNGPNGWSWDTTAGTALLCAKNNNRRGLVITNNSRENEAYILLGNSTDTCDLSGFVTINNIQEPPETYSFLLEAGGVYFADHTTCGLSHSVYMMSSSMICELENCKILVTEIY